jgi:hypothetical protein
MVTQMKLVEHAEIDSIVCSAHLIVFDFVGSYFHRNSGAIVGDDKNVGLLVVAAAGYDSIVAQKIR